MQEAIKEVCGESVGDIESMYNEMKQNVQELSTIFYEMETTSCNNKPAQISEDTIKVINCKNKNSIEQIL